MSLENIKTSPKLEQILFNLIDVLRINILIVDSKGNPVLVPKTNGHGFHGASKWGVLQYLGTPEFLSKFQTEGHYLKSIDQFGFHSFAIPIAMQGLDAIGYLVVGPVILNKPLEHFQYQAVTRELNIDYSDFEECLVEVRVVSFNSLKSILDLLFELSQYAQLSHSIFTTLLDLSMALTQAECGSIMLLNKLTDELSILTYKGIDSQKFSGVPMKLSDGIAGLAVQNRESVVINAGQPNNRIDHLLKKPELKCAMVLPIMKNNKEILGVMNISTHQETSRLATHSQEMLKSLTEITSGVFNNYL